ncbi:MAG: hypothetical protein KAG96_06395 [Ichthyobacteriaceae bacterium]|nr:hypothetical protein [Ichthyobacteriaceae bacterium]
MTKNILLGTLVVLLLHLPFFILGEDSFVLILDNLDADVSYMQVLKLSGKLLIFNDSSLVPNISNGLSRSYFHSEYSFVRVLFYYLPTFWAYVVNSIIVRLVGLIGVCLLAKDYFGADKKSNYLSLLIAISFAILPLYTIFGLSVTGQPLILWAFLNLKKNHKLIVSSVIILLFPFYSHFSLAGIFIVGALVAYWLFDYFFNNNNKQKAVNYWFGIIVITLMYVIANISIFRGFIFDSTETIRDEFTNSYPSVLDVFGRTLTLLFRGKYLSSEYYSFPIVFLLIYILWKKTEQAETVKKLGFIILLISVFYGGYHLISVPLEGKLQIVTAFRFHRVYFLLPFLFLLILLFAYKDNLLNKKVLYTTVILFISTSLFANKEFSYSIALNVLPAKYTSRTHSYKSFYSEHLFGLISKHINKPKANYRIASLGLHPAMAQYNGFYTVDFYLNYYPLSVKKEFRQVISKEIDKSDWIRKYYDNWGGRNYLYSSELAETCLFNCCKNSEIEINNLEINTEKLKQMGTEYIFSAVPILNFKTLNLTFDKAFEDDISKFKIYLYKL